MADDLLALRSERGRWSVSVPYNFMIWIIEYWPSFEYGFPTTEFVAISTGAAKHAHNDGVSQATLMLVRGDRSNETAFVRHWLKEFGFEEEGSPKATRPGLPKTQSRYDEATRLHSEVAILGRGESIFVVSYAGLPGTYEWNRVHFLDFLSGLQDLDAAPAQANKPLQRTGADGAGS